MRLGEVYKRNRSVIQNRLNQKPSFNSLPEIIKLKENIKEEKKEELEEREEIFFERVHGVFLFCLCWGVGGSIHVILIPAFESSVHIVLDKITSSPPLPYSKCLFYHRFNINLKRWED